MYMSVLHKIGLEFSKCGLGKNDNSNHLNGRCVCGCPVVWYSNSGLNNGLKNSQNSNGWPSDVTLSFEVSGIQMNLVY